MVMATDLLSPSATGHGMVTKGVTLTVACMGVDNPGEFENWIECTNGWSCANMKTRPVKLVVATRIVCHVDPASLIQLIIKIIKILDP